jgi:N-acetylmuramoyl-L-alanine amidase
LRNIHTIVIHYTATPEGRHHDVADIRRWHKERGFSDIGYHYLIHIDGTIELGRPIGVVGAHCKGHNTGTIGVCYVGGTRNGKSSDTRTKAQVESLKEIIKSLQLVFGPLKVVGHRDLAPTECPGFDVTKEFI